jgi:hypothetical protein
MTSPAPTQLDHARNPYRLAERAAIPEVESEGDKRGETDKQGYPHSAPWPYRLDLQGRHDAALLNGRKQVGQQGQTSDPGQHNPQWATVHSRSHAEYRRGVVVLQCDNLVDHSRVSTRWPLAVGTPA